MKLDNEAPANSNHAPDSEFDYLVPGPARDAALAGHPLTLDEQMLQTDGIHMAHSLVSRGIRFRKYGVAFVCTPRIGKTWAIDALIAMLKVDNPNMPVFSTEAMQHDDPTEKALWTDILS